MMMFGNLHSAPRGFQQRHEGGALYDSARRAGARFTAIFSSTGRLSDGRMPNG